jgi:hypothetical protein
MWASGARPPAAVASCATKTVVWRTMLSISKLTFTSHSVPTEIGAA